MEKTRWLQSIDWTTLLVSLAIVFFGVINVYSVDPAKGIKQLVFFGLGVALLVFVMILNAGVKNFFRTFAPIIYLVSILSLIGVLILGKEINGAKAWYKIGSFSLQPAEFSKMATALFLGYLISQTQINIRSFKGFLTVCLTLAAPVGLILLQPDLGSILIYFAFLIALYRQGLHWAFVVLPVLLIVFFLLSLIQQPLLLLLGLLYGSLAGGIIWFNTGRNDAVTEKRILLQPIWIAQLIFTIGLSLILMFSSRLIDVQYLRNIADLRYWGMSGVGLETFFSFVVLFFNLLFLVLIRKKKEVPSKYSFRPVRDKQLGWMALQLGALVLGVWLLIGTLSFSSKYLFQFLPEHQQERIFVLFEGEDKYREGSGYNLLYSKTAIGSGALTGKGFQEGTVKKGSFVPEQSTDFIFCTVGEEWGFLGALFVLLLYTLLILRIYYLSETYENSFNQFFGYAVASILLMHYLINIGMVTGLFPTVGIPLPFFSYGGSSLWSMMLLVGLFLILHFQNRESLF